MEDGLKDRLRPYIMNEVIYVEGFEHLAQIG
jgi:hypothetical protein